MVALSCNQGFYVRDTTASFSVNLYCEWREKNIKEKKLSVSSLYLSMYQLYYRLIWLPIFRANLVRGPWNKEIKFQNKGAVLVQIAPLFISQPRNQNQSIVTLYESTVSGGRKKIENVSSPYLFVYQVYDCVCNTLQHTLLQHHATHTIYVSGLRLCV